MDRDGPSAWITDRWLGQPAVCWSCGEAAAGVAFALLGTAGPPGGAVAVWGWACFCEACAADKAEIAAEAQLLGADFGRLLQRYPVPRHALGHASVSGQAATLAGDPSGLLRPVRPWPGWPTGGVLPATAMKPSAPVVGDGPDPWDAPDAEGERVDDVLERRMERRARR